MRDGKRRVIPEILDHELPIAYNGCTCICHKIPGVMHCMPCCSSPDKECWNCIHIDREPDGNTTPFCYEGDTCVDISSVKGGCPKFEFIY